MSGNKMLTICERKVDRFFSPVLVPGTLQRLPNALSPKYCICHFDSNDGAGVDDHLLFAG